ncbi:unnamed protein product [Peniophora sp. CBMAI 1063]|nr:unnamed protein product [Peniophora sp. CBMAI 1063]
MPEKTSAAQPQRRSARIKSSQHKAGPAPSQASKSKPPAKAEASRKKQKVAEAPPLPKRRRRHARDVEMKGLPSRASRGSLNRLLEISLDILLEIFTHVMPGDLLKVACLNKSFSELLLSRRSISIWRASLECAYPKGYPPKPDEWTEIAWVQLVSGGRICGLCGAMTTLDILWAFRVRLCASCRDEHVYYSTSQFVEHRLRDERKDIRTLIPTCTVQSYYGRSTSYILDEDVLAYHAELEELHQECSTEALFLVKRDELDAEMTEHTRSALAHAELCEKSTERLKDQQATDKEAEIKHRVAQIYDRLLGLGKFEAADLEEPIIRRHKDVNNPRPLTKEGWERLKPKFVELAKQAKKSRLEREKVERRRAREKLVAVEYRALLARVAPETSSLMPTIAELLKLPQISSAIVEDQAVTDALRGSVSKALSNSLPTISESIKVRADAFRKTIPHSWPVMSFDQGVPTQTATTKSGQQKQVDLHSCVAGLDLAAYTFSCARATPTDSYDDKSCRHSVLYGLDAMAHTCPTLTEVTLKPTKSYHKAVLRILDALQLAPDTTTVSMLDNLDPVFVNSSSGTHWSSGGYSLIGWRQAVAHIAHSASKPKMSPIRLLTAPERRWYSSETDANGDRLSHLTSDPGDRPQYVEHLPVWGLCGKYTQDHADLCPMTTGDGSLFLKSEPTLPSRMT